MGANLPLLDVLPVVVSLGASVPLHALRRSAGETLERADFHLVLRRSGGGNSIRGIFARELVGTVVFCGEELWN